jgi:hypothetical protein
MMSQRSGTAAGYTAVSVLAVRYRWVRALTPPWATNRAFSPYRIQQRTHTQGAFAAKIGVGARPRLLRDLGEDRQWQFSDI